MSSGGFFNLISRLPLASWLARRVEAVSEIDPERIYVENVRSALGIPHAAAKLICEAGVREGTLRRLYGYWCPTEGGHRLVEVSERELGLDEEVICEDCELRGISPHAFKAGEMRREVIYAIR